MPIGGKPARREQVGRQPSQQASMPVSKEESKGARRASKPARQSEPARQNKSKTKRKQGKNKQEKLKTGSKKQAKASESKRKQARDQPGPNKSKQNQAKASKTANTSKQNLSIISNKETKPSIPKQKQAKTSKHKQKRGKNKQKQAKNKHRSYTHVKTTKTKNKHTQQVSEPASKRQRKQAGKRASQQMNKQPPTTSASKAVGRLYRRMLVQTKKIRHTFVPVILYTRTQQWAPAVKEHNVKKHRLRSARKNKKTGLRNAAQQCVCVNPAQRVCSSHYVKPFLSAHRHRARPVSVPILQS